MGTAPTSTDYLGPMTRALTLTILFAAAACGRPLPPEKSRVPAPTARPHSPLLSPVFAAVRPARLASDVARLAGFGTRHTLSETASTTRGIGAARTWIDGELASVPGVQASLEAHTVPADGKRVPHDTEVIDVVGVLPGAMPAAAGRRYYVVAHYDSRVTDVMDAVHDAPGANDDASGVAVVLELARVLAGRHLDSSVVFLATAGEEQGLYGSRAHARAAREQHLDVRAVLNDDIVGDPSDPTGGRHEHAIRVFSAGIPPTPPRTRSRKSAG